MSVLPPIIFVILAGFGFLLGKAIILAKEKTLPYLLLAFNVALLSLIMSPIAVLWVFGFVLGGYALIRLKATLKDKLFGVLLLIMVIGFTVFKQYEILPLEPLYAYIPAMLGISYIIFRMINLLFEAHEKQTVPELIDYLNFTLSLFTFLAGPIQRYKDFTKDMESMATYRLNETQTAQALSRLLGGAIKVMLVAPIFQSGMGYVSGKIEAGRSLFLILPPEYDAALGLFIALLFFLWYLYFNFAGFTDIVIALGRLCGFKLPENFEKPFATSSFLEFWTCWHMSLSSWFKDFCFTPILKFCMKHGIKDVVLLTLPAYAVAFACIGIWHGRTWPFLFCGAMFAFAALSNQAYREYIAKRVFGKNGYKSLQKNIVYLSFSASFAFLYIAVSVIGLWLGGEQILDWLDQSGGMMTLSISFVAVFFALGIAVLSYRFAQRLFLFQMFIEKPVSGFFASASALSLAVKLFIIITVYISFLSGVPDFVYQGF